MSDVDIVTVKSAHLAMLLKQQYHAQGEELEQLISSCEERLPHDVLGKLHYIATITGNGMPENKAFMEAYDQCISELTPRSGKFVWRVAILVMVSITLFAMVLYYIHWEKLEANLLN